MSKQNSDKRSGGIGVASLLGIAFIVLKLTGYIDWSWWWVTAPFWVVPAILLAIWLIAVVIVALMESVEKASTRRKKQQHKE